MIKELAEQCAELLDRADLLGRAAAVGIELTPRSRELLERERISVAEGAELIGTHRHAVGPAVREGRIEGGTRIGHTWTFTPEAFVSWRETCPRWWGRSRPPEERTRPRPPEPRLPRAPKGISPHLLEKRRRIAALGEEAPD